MPGSIGVLQADGSSAKKAAKKAKSTGATPWHMGIRAHLSGVHV